MKRSTVATLLGLTATLAATSSSLADGYIYFDNYSSGNYLHCTYDTSFGALAGTGVGSGFHAALYYSIHDNVNSVASDPTGSAIPETLGGGLQLVTQSLYTPNRTYPTPFMDGLNSGYFSGSAVVIPGYTGTGDLWVTFMVAAYNGTDYASSTIRGHSDAFAQYGLSTGGINIIAYFQPAIADNLTQLNFEVHPVPEPATLAFLGIGLLALGARFRRTV